MNTSAPGCFITATDTDAGKTVITAALLRAMLAGGVNACAVKPVQTGCEKAGGLLLAPDAMVCSQALGHSRDSTYAARALHCYEPACAPHWAAARTGEKLVAAELACEVRRAAAGKEFCLVEGAGGILAPLSEEETMMDLMLALRWHVLLAVPNRLGCLSHALSCMKILAAAAIKGAGLILCRTEQNAPENETLLAENSRYLAAHGPEYGFPLLAELPFLPDLSSNEEVKQYGAWEALAGLLAPAAHKLTAANAGGGQSKKNLIELDSRCIWHPYAGTDPAPKVLQAVRGDGAYICLADGRRLLDGMSSWWCANLGYTRPDLETALREQAGCLAHVMFGGLTHEPAVLLAQKLLAIAPGEYQRVFFTDSGSVAVEVAIKMALQYQLAEGHSHKTRICALRGAYHGDTLGAMSVCDPVNGMHSIFGAALPAQFFLDRPQTPFGAEIDPASLDAMEQDLRAHAHDLAAVIVEPIAQGAGGMWFYHPDYLRLLRRICSELDIILIADEIATGFGRTGKLFACEWAGIAPDILCTGKALTGGFMSFAAVLAAAKIAETISRPKPQGQPGILLHGPTFMANPLACAVALQAVNTLLESPWQENVNRIEKVLQRSLEPCRYLPGVRDVRVLGAIGVAEMKEKVNAGRLQAFFVEQGVWIRPFNNLIYIMPPFISSDAEVEKLATAVCAACELEIFR